MAELIVACDDKYGIGYQGKLPWYCKEELDLFKKFTMGKVLVVGRKTYDSLPKTLPGRTIVVLSRDSTKPRTCQCMTDITKVTTLYKWQDRVIFAGGAEIYKQALEKGMVKKVYLSKMKSTHPADTWFDNNWLANFVITQVTDYPEFTHYTLEVTRHGERQYLDLLHKVLLHGDERVGRNGTTLSLFNSSMTFDLRNGYPLLTTKRMFIRGVVEELLFFLRGDTNTKILEEKGVNIWRGNTSREFLDSLGMTERPEGVMGPMYGYTLRHFGAKYDEQSASPKEPGIDQLAYVVNTIRNDPYSRRILMTTFNPGQVNEGVLYPCHSIVLQFYCQDNYLDMFCYNRSQDLFLGVPFNIASSALLLTLIAKLTNRVPRFLYMTLGDCHIYSNHVDQVKVQLARYPFEFPALDVPSIQEIDDLAKLTSADFKLTDYMTHDAIKAEMVV